MATNRTTAIVTLALVAAAALNACYQAKSPDQVAKDTTAAENAAVHAAGKAEEKAAAKDNSAQTVVSDEQAAAAHTDAVEARKVADTEAAGKHKIALAECESMSGEQQKACREQADTAFTTAQDVARQVKADTDPKP